MDFKDDDIVCPCSGTKLSKLRQRFCDGLKTLEALSDATGVCSGCAGCESDVEELIEGFRAAELLTQDKSSSS
ncbi:MAG TPA: (2Fe-2S)-binding protein [Methylococcaceae bacterium]|jgi:NAD(P)H-nitrite reductase large subunit|nr:(2Fe-2S)-binding protein [Methylococcaceae bacterium]